MAGPNPWLTGLVLPLTLSRPVKGLCFGDPFRPREVHMKLVTVRCAVAVMVPVCLAASAGSAQEGAVQR